MTKLFRPGRPKLDNALTNAQKQKLYRERLRSKNEANDVNFICTIDKFEDQKKRISELQQELDVRNALLFDYYEFVGKYASAMPSEHWVEKVKFLFDK